jgi:hypothetical protein
VPAFAERNFFRLVGAIWLLAGLAILFVSRDAIAAWKVGDPDDQMRMVQVRDWLAGQSWWDITQYRMNAPDGGDMHWSRLVDVPLGAVLTILTPFLGQSLAEQTTAAIVPLFTMGVIMALYAAAARRIFGPVVALVATGLLVTIIPFTAQVIPMRIDHHGWQLACFAAALWALFDRKAWLGSAVVLGLACAFWIEISVEGLPFAALLLGLSALAWVFPPLAPHPDGRRLHFPIAITSAALGTAGFFGITESWTSPNFCDALSPVHIAALSAMAVVILAAVVLEKKWRIFDSVYFRLVAGVVAASSGVAALLLIAPQCAGDAFAGLDPLVREYWFSRVPEGLPLWAVQLDFAIQQYAYMLAGGVAFAFLGLWNRQLAATDKIRIAFLFFGAVVIGAWVSRTAVYAMMLANILLAAMLIHLFAAAERQTNLVLRMALRIIAILLAMPNLSAQFVLNQVNAAEAKADPVAERFNINFEKQALLCQKSASAAALNRLPPSVIMAGLDTNPAILQFTKHRVVASGHHRNQAAMADVIRTFVGSEVDAAQIIGARSIGYLVTCDGSFELGLYQRSAPKGFLAQLRKGNVPSWLRQQPNIGPFQIYEVQRTALPKGLRR